AEIAGLAHRVGEARAAEVDRDDGRVAEPERRARRMRAGAAARDEDLQRPAGRRERLAREELREDRAERRGVIEAPETGPARVRVRLVLVLDRARDRVVDRREPGDQRA